MNYSFFKRTISQKEDNDNTIQLRNRSTQHLRYRTMSDHPQHAVLKASVDEAMTRSSFPVENLPRNETELVNDLIMDIERNRDLVMEKMEEMTKDIANLKKSLKK